MNSADYSLSDSGQSDDSGGGPHVETSEDYDEEDTIDKLMEYRPKAPATLSMVETSRQAGRKSVGFLFPD